MGVDHARGWRLDKTKASHKSVVVALSLAALAAVRGQIESNYDPWSPEWDAAWGTAGNLDEPAAEQRPSEAQRHYDELLQRYGQPVSFMLPGYRQR
jgi:hypothetical protein